MPEIVADLADPLSSRCNSAAFGPGIEETQRLDPDPFLINPRDARGRFAKGSSGNPRGRPRGIPNPRRRLPNFSASPVNMEALSKLLDRKPHLWRPVANQLLPPPLAAVDPAERLGIDLNSLHTAEDCRQILAAVLAAIARGELTPTEGARIAKQVRARLRLFMRQVRARLRAVSRRKTGARKPFPPFRGKREGPRRDSAGEGEVGAAALCLVDPLTLPSPPAGGEES